MQQGLLWKLMQHPRTSADATPRAAVMRILLKK
jgi:hypothetical protein